MPFRRVWDASCPHIYDTWEADGKTWIIQDLEPQDDDEACELLLKNLVPDEALCIASGLGEEPESFRSMGEFWQAYLPLRTSIACYVKEKHGKKLAAVNCCLILSENDDEQLCKIEGDAWKNVHGALHYAETRVNAFELLGVDRLLYGMGLAVKREYRGAYLGSRVLAARERLCKLFGVKGTSTVFTGVASQKSAEKAGFKTVAEVTFKQLSEEAGLKYPHEEKSIKFMIKKFAS